MKLVVQNQCFESQYYTILVHFLVKNVSESSLMIYIGVRDHPPKISEKDISGNTDRFFFIFYIYKNYDFTAQVKNISSAIWEVSKMT